MNKWRYWDSGSCYFTNDAVLLLPCLRVQGHIEIIPYKETRKWTWGFFWWAFFFFTILKINFFLTTVNHNKVAVFIGIHLHIIIIYSKFSWNCSLYNFTSNKKNRKVKKILLEVWKVPTMCIFHTNTHLMSLASNENPNKWSIATFLYLLGCLMDGFSQKFT